MKASSSCRRGSLPRFISRQRVGEQFHKANDPVRSQQPRLALQPARCPRRRGDDARRIVIELLQQEDIAQMAHQLLGELPEFLALVGQPVDE